jgi:hypothetical protein
VPRLAREDTLRAVVDRLIPDDGTPGAIALGIDDAIRARLPHIDELLARLQGFELLDDAAQDLALERLESHGDALFARLVELAHVAFYADPRSWPALGYSTRIPGRP